MIKNVGKKIKIASIILIFAGILIACVAGYMFSNDFATQAFIIAVIIVVSVFLGFMVYGFGIIVEKAEKMDEIRDLLIEIKDKKVEIKGLDNKKQSSILNSNFNNEVFSEKEFSSDEPENPEYVNPVQGNGVAASRFVAPSYAGNGNHHASTRPVINDTANTEKKTEGSVHAVKSIRPVRNENTETVTEERPQERAQERPQERTQVVNRVPSQATVQRTAPAKAQEPAPARTQEPAQVRSQESAQARSQEPVQEKAQEPAVVKKPVVATANAAAAPVKRVAPVQPATPVRKPEAAAPTVKPAAEHEKITTSAEVESAFAEAFGTAKPAKKQDDAITSAFEDNMGGRAASFGSAEGDMDKAVAMFDGIATKKPATTEAVSLAKEPERINPVQLYSEPAEDDSIDLDDEPGVYESPEPRVLTPEEKARAKQIQELVYKFVSRRNGKVNINDILRTVPRNVEPIEFSNAVKELEDEGKLIKNEAGDYTAVK